jgi:hypothetical protein
METPDTIFTIPTYRLRDVPETVERYHENFWLNGHEVALIVFDDSSLVNYHKYYAQLEATRTANPVYYVGPREKEQFIQVLLHRLREPKLEVPVRNLFRPSYGVNRNFALMYSLGAYLVSSDDDMRPSALIEHSPESLVTDEICRGKLMKAKAGGFEERSFDLLTAFNDVLGKTVRDLPGNYENGDLVTDTSIDLETNTTKTFSRVNSLILQRGKVPAKAVVKIAQTFRTGTNDIDALDYVEMFLDDEQQLDPYSLNDVYVLVNFRPVVTNNNWRIDCGVAAYDNRYGLPPFFPTRLRFEDYIYRLWIQQSKIVSAHVDAAQRHMKNNYMRNPLAMEVFNEELCSLLKRRIKDSVFRRDDLNIAFHYAGEVALEESEAILRKVTAVHKRVLAAADRAHDPALALALRAFATNLAKSFYGFEPDFFQQNVSRIVDDVISQIRGSLELWPTLVEICYFRKDKAPLPRTRVRNPPRNNGKSR